MTRGRDEADWTGSIPAMATLDQATRERLRGLAQSVTAPAGTRLFDEGSPCQAYLFLLSGQVRVQKIGESGREIVLYRVAAGETCVITTACLLGGSNYDVEGIAETAINARIVPAALFRELLAQSASFRDCVFKTFGARISTLLTVIEGVAFGRVDRRLAACLLERAGPQGEVAATHQELANDLGSVREVVSRQLKEFERRGWVKLGRGHLVLASRDALDAFARG